MRTVTCQSSCRLHDDRIAQISSVDWQCSGCRSGAVARLNVSATALTGGILLLKTVGYLFLSTASTVGGILLRRNIWIFVSDRHTCCVCLLNIAFLRNTSLVILYSPCWVKEGRNFMMSCSVGILGVWTHVSILGSCEFLIYWLMNLANDR